MCAKSNSGNDGNARHWASLHFVDPVRLYINIDFCDFPCFLLLSLLSCRLFPFFGLSPFSCFRLLSLLPCPCFRLLSFLSCLRLPCLSLLLLSCYLILSVFPYPCFLFLFLLSRFLAVSFFACPAFCFVVSFSSFSLSLLSCFLILVEASRDCIRRCCVPSMGVLWLSRRWPHDGPLSKGRYGNHRSPPRVSVGPGHRLSTRSLQGSRSALYLGVPVEANHALADRRAQ